jgi:hypothetical protein
MPSVPRSGGPATKNDNLSVIPDHTVQVLRDSPRPEQKLQVPRPEQKLQKENAFQLFPKHDFESLESYSETLPKSYIDSETGETKLISKKTVEVWCNGIPMCYKDFRNSSPEDSLLFILGPEGSQECLDNSYLFIGYSKKQLYEEYTLVAHDSFFVLDIIEEESYVIPMHQIVRILEYSHVMYLIEKTGKVISDNSYISMIRPLRFT